MKNQGHSHKDPDRNNGEHRGDKKVGDYLSLAPFSLSHSYPKADGPEHHVA
jgi:hypothetical protein